jgi:hypothetical protein
LVAGEAMHLYRLTALDDEDHELVTLKLERSHHDAEQTGRRWVERLGPRYSFYSAQYVNPRDLLRGGFA